jgi:hypothetical protein
MLSREKCRGEGFTAKDTENAEKGMIENCRMKIGECKMKTKG